MMVKKLNTLQMPIRIELLTILLCDIEHISCVHRNLFKKNPRHVRQGK